MWLSYELNMLLFGILLSSVGKITEGIETEEKGITSRTASTSVLISSTYNESRDPSQSQTEAYEYYDYDAYMNMPLTIISKYIFKIYPPIMLIIGGLGNTLSIIIMRRPSFAESPTSLYFIILAGI